MALVGLYSLATLLGYTVMSSAWHRSYAGRWALIVSALLAYQLWSLWRRLADNHRAGETELLPSLGPANLISLLRGLCLAMLAGFILSPRPQNWLAWVPGILYTIAILADYLDGLVARLTGLSTVLGSALDLDYDAFGILVAPLLAVWYGQLPVWYLAVSAARYFFMFGVGVRKRLGQSVYDLPPSALRRPMAGIQMGFISAVLWPVFTPPTTTVAAAIFMAPFLIGFIRDWLVVSGTLHADSPRYRSYMAAWSTATGEWLPLALRAAIALAVGVWTTHSLNMDQPPHLAVVAVQGVAGLLIAFGILGRLMAVILLIATGLMMAGTSSLDLASLALIVSAILLIHVGTGKLSLWKPEEAFLTTRFGDQRRVGV